MTELGKSSVPIFADDLIDKNIISLKQRQVFAIVQMLSMDCKKILISRS